VRIVVRTPNWLGDVIMCLPALADLHASFPGASIDYLATPAGGEVCSRLGLGGRVLPLPPRSPRRRLVVPILRELWSHRADLGLVFPPSFSAALFFFLGGVRRRVGFPEEGRGFLLSAAEPRPARGTRHLSEEYRSLAARAAREMGVPYVRAEAPRLRPTNADARALEALLGGEGERPILLAPGASYGPTKRWPASSFAALGDRLVDTLGGSILLTGAEADRPVCEEVRTRLRAPARNLAGQTTIGQLVALCSAARLVVSNDSGAMHVAAATGAPLVAVFGSTSPEWTGPSGERVRIVRRAEPCAPCFRASCEIGIVCLTRITTEEVFAACREVVTG